MTVPVPVIVLTPLGLAWIFTKVRRILPSTKEKILKRLHPGELDKLKDFMPHNNFADILKTDAEFYDSIGGFQGLLRERENAVCCVQLCQLYVRESNMDKNDVDYVSLRSFAIGFLVLASIPEHAIRLFLRPLFWWWRMPHFCARWIVYLYWDTATYTNSLNLEYGTGNLTL